MGLSGFLGGRIHYGSDEEFYTRKKTSVSSIEALIVLNMMHGLRASLVGQTFALAKSNESGDKKSRIRRSKEERKAMVDSFIKRHQKLNNGSFPSLRMTHKEVGGSFYIVREIVREIIQENKVLGTSKLIPEKIDTYQQQKQDPEVPLSTSLNYNGHFMQDQQEVPEEKPLTFHEHGQHVNGSRVDVENKEAGRKLSESFEEEGVFGSDKLKFDEQNTDQLLEQNSSGSFSGKSGVSLTASSDKIHPVPDEDHVQNGFSPKPGNRSLENGTFKKTACREEPKSPETFEVEKTVKDIPAANSEATNVTEGTTATRVTITDISKSVDVETFPLRPVTPVVDITGRLVELENASQTLKQNETERAIFVADNGSAKPVDPADTALPSSGLHEEIVDGEAKDLLSNKAFTMADTRSSNYTKIEESKTERLPSQTIEPNQPAANTEKKKTLQDAPAKGNKAMLNRTRLETLKGARDDAAGAETNPLSAILKSFITAFLRFWSE